MQQSCNERVRILKDKVASLQARLGQAGISADDVELLPSDKEPEAEVAAKNGHNGQIIPVENGNGEEQDDSKLFEVRKEWLRKIDTSTWGKQLDSFVRRKKAEYNTDPHAVVHNLTMMECEAVDNTPKVKYIINPTSTFRLAWDLLGLMLIGYDVFTVPFVQAFQPSSSIFSEFMDWFALIFWTGDMLQGFFLGYYEKGYFVDDNRKIVMHYLRSWFLVDTIVVGPEWVILIAGSVIASQSGNQVNAFAKMIKGARAVRVLRLLRLLKLQRIMNLMYDLIESEWTFIVVNLMKMLFFVVVLNHVIACLWFYIGRLAWESEQRNWIVVGNVNGTELAYSYTTSLHWSLTQFTPASMDISARNTWERIFSIIVLFFALVTFSSIVASITGSTTSLRNMKTDEMKQFWLLRRYLRQRNVSNDLANRIFKFLEHHLRIQSKLVQRSTIKILDGLSESLHNEMTHQMLSPHLSKHPLFINIDTNMQVIMQRISRHALKAQSYAEQETVFSWGDAAKKMYFIKGGNLIYTSMDGAAIFPHPRPKEWVSEPVLWTTWRHQGDLIADDNSELISVDPNTFLEVMAAHPRPWLFAKHYAACFIKMLNNIPRLELTDFLRDPVFYDDAVRESEDMFRCEETRKTMIRASVVVDASFASFSSEDEASSKLDADEQEALGMVSDEEVVAETKMPKAAEKQQPRLLRLCPCNKGVPMCLP